MLHLSNDADTRAVTALEIKGRMLCDKGCINCVETNFRTGSSFAFNDILDAVGLKDKSFQGVPVDGTCVSFSSGGAWSDGRDGGTSVTVDYKFEGFCVGKPYEGRCTVTNACFTSHCR